jgi:hypothetical protein
MIPTRRTDMTVFTVVELEQDSGKDKTLADTRVFSNREKAQAFLHERYDHSRLWADAGAGERAADYSEDGWYHVTDNDGNVREGYLSAETAVDGQKPARTDTEILKELMDVLMEYNSDRDSEWDFVDEHGLDESTWNEENVEEHQQILDDIQRNRTRIRDILREATGDATIEF